MDDEPNHVASPRSAGLAEKMRSKAYRDAYAAAHTRQFLARQVRAFRGSRSQMQFAEMIGKRQTVVSRLEDPNYGKWTLQTLLDVARKLDVAVFVRFVDFPTFINLTNDMSEEAARPRPYGQSLLEIPAGGEQPAIGESARQAFYSMSVQTTQTEPSVSAARALAAVDKGLSKTAAPNTVLACDLAA